MPTTTPDTIVRAAFDRLNAHDLDGYYALLAEDISYTAMTTTHGRAAARAVDAAGFAALPDHWRRIDRLLVSGDVVAVWLTFGGTPATTGEAMEVEFCNIFEVRDGLIQALTIYTDWPALFAQLGG